MMTMRERVAWVRARLAEGATEAAVRAELLGQGEDDFLVEEALRRVRASRNASVWTAEEIEVLRAIHPWIARPDVKGAVLGRQVAAVYKAAKRHVRGQLCPVCGGRWTVHSPGLWNVDAERGCGAVTWVVRCPNGHVRRYTLTWTDEVPLSGM